MREMPRVDHRDLVRGHCRTSGLCKVLPSILRVIIRDDLSKPKINKHTGELICSLTNCLTTWKKMVNFHSIFFSCINCFVYLLITDDVWIPCERRRMDQGSRTGRIVERGPVSADDPHPGGWLFSQ